MRRQAARRLRAFAERLDPIPRIRVAPGHRTEMREECGRWTKHLVCDGAAIENALLKHRRRNGRTGGS